MRKGEVINGYLVLQDFSTKGGSMSKWTFASKGEQSYFLKEYLSPKYPDTGAPGSEAVKARRRKECDEFASHQVDLIGKVKSRVAPGGNLVFPVDFFRQGPSYYKVTEKIDVASISPSDIARWTPEARLLAMKTACHSLGILHALGIVHGDLKPDNVLIKSTETGKYTTKLIDFDNSYFEGHPPSPDELVGDQTYYSPEMLAYVKGASTRAVDRLTTRSDIFALGIIFHQYWSGAIPDFDRKKHSYPADAALAGGLHVAPSSCPPPLREVITAMLATDPARRPSSGEALTHLRSLGPLTATGPYVAATEGGGRASAGGEVAPASRLRGSMLTKGKEPAKAETPAGGSPRVDTPGPSSPAGRLRGKGLRLGRDK